MSSTYAVFPSTDQIEQSHGTLEQDSQQYQQYLSPSTPTYASRNSNLTAISPQLNNNITSPVSNQNTPAESIASIHYQSSEYDDNDIFCSVNFDAVERATPSFLDEQVDPLSVPQSPAGPEQASPYLEQTVSQATQQTLSYSPLSPDNAPSSARGYSSGADKEAPISQGMLSNSADASPMTPQNSSTTHPQQQSKLGPAPLTRETFANGHLGQPNITSPSHGINPTSPRITISHWPDDPDRETLASDDADKDKGSSGLPSTCFPRDESGRWIPNPTTGQGGVDPSQRTDEEVPSLNDYEKQQKEREQKERTQRMVNDWLHSFEPAAFAAGENPGTEEPTAASPTNSDDDGIPNHDVSLGHLTLNIPKPGEIFFTPFGRDFNDIDRDLLAQTAGPFSDKPVPIIRQPEKDEARYQPQTANEAIKKMNDQYDRFDTISRQATCGTGRFSLLEALDVVALGNALAQVKIREGEDDREEKPRRSTFAELLTFVENLTYREARNILHAWRTKQSAGPGANKRSRNESDGSSFHTESTMDKKDRRESQSKLNSIVASKSARFKKQSVPNIDTAVVGVGSSIAAVGTSHARTGSVSAAPPATSPKSPIRRSFSFTKPKDRFRSKSDVTAPGNISELLRKMGGPPVVNLGNPAAPVPDVTADPGIPSGAGTDDEDEDEDDDSASQDGEAGPSQETETKTESAKLIEEITPTMEGFRQHILRLNPYLVTHNQYLVDRLAHHQVIRYKQLLTARQKHLRAGTNCLSGSMCIAMGGRANILDAKGDPRSVNPLDGADGDVSPLEGAITQENFPEDIPMPPTNVLPAEFECQLCFATKKFQKPSDWTKHVHEDVQPFTCTWEHCPSPNKPFKRKADWLRHENEGHRHPEWWQCELQECNHICYRRDNFIQHLVREHKLPEPKIKSKAAVKKQPLVHTDPTLSKVEAWHHTTNALPNDEHCRFCGRSFPTWKRLTVHLAKHMEQISLPVLKLVAKQPLSEDTVISPVQDPPPRHFFPPKQESAHHTHQPQHQPNAFMPSSTIPHQGPLPRGSPGPIQGFPHQPQPFMYAIPSPPPAGGYDPAPTLYSPPAFSDPSHALAAQAQFFPSHPQTAQPSPVVNTHVFQSLNSQTAAAFSATPTPSTPVPPANAVFHHMSPMTPVSGVQATPVATTGAAYMPLSGVSMPVVGGTMSPELDPFPALGGMPGLHGMGDTNRMNGVMGVGNSLGLQQGAAAGLGLGVVGELEQQQGSISPSQVAGSRFYHHPASQQTSS
ncbi:uncharacterized protein CTHT_0053900 [Thermochaetoides thermophila DSM 1495]|uniref:C2H2-type domain-containing protein n=1 Tax=Chaetomium thermophilum (strain DSM 1495 / CBS 144.50 / IMI 039719) TaxID=759272 RepID=G0SBK5_CHATD|nr:hypothetical protein CTHT_0053900 [Thermochaetoides thermophila DSM 1495]EGS18781.1 hypothetical protein CTHT_0053900 [Thermochaetoides thermophila DSM 1495]